MIEIEVGEARDPKPEQNKEVDDHFSMLDICLQDKLGWSKVHGNQHIFQSKTLSIAANWPVHLGSGFIRQTVVSCLRD